MSGVANFGEFTPSATVSGDVDDDHENQADSAGLNWRLAAIIGGAIFFLAVASITFVQLMIDERRAMVLAGVEGRLHALAVGRAETLGAWLEARASSGRRLSQSELVQLFVAESGMAANDPKLRLALDEQRPYMRQVVGEFADQQTLVGAYLLDRQGRVLLHDHQAPNRQDFAATRSETEPLLIGKPMLNAERVLIDLYLPIPAPQRFLAEPSSVVGSLVITLDITERLARILQNNELSLPGEEAFLRLGDGTVRTILWSDNGHVIRQREQSLTGDNGGIPEGAEREDLSDEERLEMMSGVPGTPWTMVQTQDAAYALAPVRSFANVARWAVFGGVFLLIALLASLLFWQRNKYLGRLVRLYQDLAGRLMQQKKLLSQITTATRDWIALKDQDGRFLVVNPAFADAVGCCEKSLIGKTEADVLPPATMSLLRQTDELNDGNVVQNSIRLSEETALEVGGKLKYLETLTSPVLGENGAPVGELTVFHDVSELAVERQRRNTLLRRTVGAFQRAVELVDPYLLGHTHRLQQTAETLGQAMSLDRADLETLRLAAGFSQLGKLFVPREIVAKQGRHNEAESRIMQQHISHALGIIADVGLGDEVQAALAQMHERLDGSGYPNGLQGEGISIHGRILAVSDVFCARTTPRSYRNKEEPAKVLTQLQNNPDRYEVAVVEALADCLDQLCWNETGEIAASI